jgi:hypothetical protein
LLIGLHLLILDALGPEPGLSAATLLCAIGKATAVEPFVNHANYTGNLSKAPQDFAQSVEWAGNYPGLAAATKTPASDLPYQSMVGMFLIDPIGKTCQNGARTSLWGRGLAAAQEFVQNRE